MKSFITYFIFSHIFYHIFYFFIIWQVSYQFNTICSAQLVFPFILFFKFRKDTKQKINLFFCKNYYFVCPFYKFNPMMNQYCTQIRILRRKVHFYLSAIYLLHFGRIKTRHNFDLKQCCFDIFSQYVIDIIVCLSKKWF